MPNTLKSKTYIGIGIILIVPIIANLIFKFGNVIGTMLQGGCI